MKLFPGVKKATAIATIFSLFFLSSCLKSGQYFTDFASSTASVDLPLAAANNNKVVPFAFVSSTTTPTIPIYVNLASPNTLSTAVTATLALDVAYLTSYNATNGTAYALLPDTTYTLTSMARSIPAGQRLDSMVVTFKFNKMDLTKSYVLPLTIATASVPIEQWNHLLINVQVKNAYDANYTGTGYIFHPSAPRAVSATYGLATAGPNTNSFPFGDLASSNYFFNLDIPSAGGALTNYQPVGAIPTGNASGLMTLDNPGNTDYSGAIPTSVTVPGAGQWVSSTYNNTYVVSTKTFFLHAGYASGGNGQATFTRQMYLKLVHQ